MKLSLFSLIALSLLATSCKPKQTGGVDVPEVVPVSVVQPNAYIPKATAFKMSGDYANNVAVSLNSAGNLSYYPAPGDLSDNSRPVEIGDGWWLNRQGLGANSVFTRYTFDEYRALKQAPSPEEIKAAIIPGARVIDFRQLPLRASEAAEMTPSSLLEYLK